MSQLRIQQRESDTPPSPDRRAGMGVALMVGTMLTVIGGGARDVLAQESGKKDPETAKEKKREPELTLAEKAKMAADARHAEAELNRAYSKNLPGTNLATYEDGLLRYKEAAIRCLLKVAKGDLGGNRGYRDYCRGILIREMSTHPQYLDMAIGGLTDGEDSRDFYPQLLADAGGIALTPTHKVFTGTRWPEKEEPKKDDPKQEKTEEKEVRLTRTELRKASKQACKTLGFMLLNREKFPDDKIGPLLLDTLQNPPVFGGRKDERMTRAPARTPPTSSHTDPPSCLNS